METKLQKKELEKVVAYFSMEIAIRDQIPNFAGGLGVLAADILCSAADLGVPLVGVSLIYHQNDDPALAFDPKKFMELYPQTLTLPIEDREMKIRIYRLEITGRTGFKIPVYFLSSNDPDNVRWDRDLTKNLYAGDSYTRLGQEYILGVGGVKALEAIGQEVDFYHMNEGHSSLLTLELLREEGGDLNAVRSRCSFTTHTPVAAGHDYFNYELAEKTIGEILPANIKSLSTRENLGMTQLALNLSKASNSVSIRHNQVCQQMFPGQDFKNITNGIHHLRWAGSAMASLFDQYLPSWREDPAAFSQAKTLPMPQLQSAKLEQKKDLLKWLNSHPEFFPLTGLEENDLFDEKTLTIGFAKRFVPYKRPELLFHDLMRLRAIGYEKLQLIFAAHCNPGDWFCEQVKLALKNYMKELRGQIKLVVLPDYNLEIAKRMVSGCDVWLNNPLQPQEASGTSGMKAALNGGLNLSILDGWWIEGYDLNPLSGWGFGSKLIGNNNSDLDANELYQNLTEVIHCYYQDPEQWVNRMKAAIGLISFFNTNRVLRQYQEIIWR